MWWLDRNLTVDLTVDLTSSGTNRLDSNLPAVRDTTGNHAAGRPATTRCDHVQWTAKRGSTSASAPRTMSAVYATFKSDASPENTPTGHCIIPSKDCQRTVEMDGNEDDDSGDETMEARMREIQPMMTCQPQICLHAFDTPLHPGCFQPDPRLTKIQKTHTCAKCACAGCSGSQESNCQNACQDCKLNSILSKSKKKCSTPGCWNISSSD